MSIKAIKTYILEIGCDKCGRNVLENIEARCSEDDYEEFARATILCNQPDCKVSKSGIPTTEGETVMGG